MAQLELIDAMMQYLVTVTDLTDLLSKSKDGTYNIRPVQVAQGSKVPYITVQQIAEDDDQQLDGSTNFTTVTYKFTIVSTSSLTNARIANVLRKNFHGYQRTLLPPNKTVQEGAIWVNSVRKTNGFEFPNSPQTGDQFVKIEQEEIYDVSIPLDDNVVHPAVI
jgi:hypothetical protein